MGLEAFLYASYRGHDARFHWFTHLFVGAGVAFLAMAAAALLARRPAPAPLLWPVLGHLIAAFPDVLFVAGIAHERWMDVFLGHLITHYVPGRNWTWYGIFLGSLAAYLFALHRVAMRSDDR
jgi:hypothetical protein